MELSRYNGGDRDKRRRKHGGLNRDKRYRRSLGQRLPSHVLQDDLLASIQTKPWTAESSVSESIHVQVLIAVVTHRRVDRKQHRKINSRFIHKKTLDDDTFLDPRCPWPWDE